MRQAKALKILTDNLDVIKREFGVKSIGVFPWRESPACGCSCGCDCYAPRAKEIGVVVDYKPGVRPDLRFFTLQFRIEELFDCGVFLTTLNGDYDRTWEVIDTLLKDAVYAEN